MLSDKDTCELRIKCLGLFVSTASKVGLEQDIVFAKAAKAWEFATETLALEEKKTPGKPTFNSRPKATSKKK